MRQLEPVGAEQGRRWWRYRDIEDTVGTLPRPPTEHVHTLILSDLHLGSPVSRAGAVIATLNTFSFEQIILNGDVFDSLDFSRLPKRHWKVLSRIRKLTSPERPMTEAWVRGNHDLGIIDVMSHLVGIPVFTEYQWTHRGRSYLAIHGDQFDSIMGSSPVITRWLGLLHHPLRALDPENRHVVAWLLKRVASWRRESARVMNGAVRHARRRAVQTVICGHTHEAANLNVDGIHYLNGGSWTQDPCSFVTIGDQGPVLHEVSPPALAT